MDVMQINVTKTKVVAINKTANPLLHIIIYASRMDFMRNFKYLTSYLKNKMKPVIEMSTSRSNAHENGELIMLCDIRSKNKTSLCENFLRLCTINSYTMNILKAFEIRIFRRLIKILVITYPMKK